eukprot:COSAG02_NODE_2051_length_10000_cov_2.340471_6_plen_87_part_00
MPSDLQYLSEENIEELGTPQCLYNRPSRFNLKLVHRAMWYKMCPCVTAGAMTHIEKMRFQGATQALSGKHTLCPSDPQILMQPLLA